MDDIEYYIGVRMAAGYDEQDFIDVCNSVAGRPSVERVEIVPSPDYQQRGVVEEAIGLFAKDSAIAYGKNRGRYPGDVIAEHFGSGGR